MTLVTLTRDELRLLRDHLDHGQANTLAAADWQVWRNLLRKLEPAEAER